MGVAEAEEAAGVGPEAEAEAAPVSVPAADE